MGPRKAAEIFLQRHPEAAAFKVTLYGSLAATGKGHMTNVAITDTLQPAAPVEIIWEPKIFLPFHPNGMKFVSLDAEGKETDTWTVFSVGGGALAEESDGVASVNTPDVYEMNHLTEILHWCERTGKSYWEYVKECEESDIWDYLAEVWETMKASVRRGLENEGVLPGPLNLRRKASTYYIRARGYKASLQSRGLVFAYALAVSEENAAGGTIVTAPTCGSCGVVPAVLYHLQQSREFSDIRIMRALATAGLLNTWNDKLAEIWQLLTASPVSYNGGAVWGVMTGIHGALQAIGYGLLVLFFAAGVVKTCGSFAEVRRPEQALKLFVRFALAKAAVDFSMDLILAVLDIVQGMISQVIGTAGASGIGTATLPQELVDTINACGFWESIPLWAVTLIGSLLITVLSFVMVLTVYGRMFSLWMYAAIAPVPLSAFAGEPTSSVGKNFLRSYAGVCLQGLVIALACIIFSALSTSAPAVDPNASAITAVWSYVGALAFNLLVLVGAVKGCDRIVKEIMGL